MHQKATFDLSVTFRGEIITIGIYLLHTVNVWRTTVVCFWHIVPGRRGLTMRKFNEISGKKTNRDFVFVRLAIKAQVNGWRFEIRVLFKVNGFFRIERNKPLNIRYNVI